MYISRKPPYMLIIYLPSLYHMVAASKARGAHEMRPVLAVLVLLTRQNLVQRKNFLQLRWTRRYKIYLW